MVNFGNDWDDIMRGEFEKEYYLKLRGFLINEYRTGVVFPSMYDIFNAQKYTAFSDVKAVIIGQDPYHGEGQAHGLSFSVKRGITPPPSLVNIFKEIHSDLGTEIPKHGELTSWAKQGVLLLNNVLTVRKGQAGSHRGNGWEIYTAEVIKKLNERDDPIVFLLWGSDARRKKELITNPKHFILETVHPSPLSAYNGFFGCKHFSKCNEFLEKCGKEKIDWSLPE